MRRKDQSIRLANKKVLFIERTAAGLGITPQKAEKLLSVLRQQSLRLNPLRYTDKDTLLVSLRQLGWQGEPYGWVSNGFSIDAGLEAVRDSDLVKKGLVYIQNAASWLPVLVLDPQPGEAILDMCAAPGGKASHIAALTNNQSKLWVNDNSRPRIAKTMANFERLGVQDAHFSLYDARFLARKLDVDQLFDKILLDAPCSGEGMLNLDTDLATWSVAHIRRLQSLQKQLITQAWQLLKPGGTLVYSTCTIAPEENEAVIDYLLRKQPNAQLEKMPMNLSDQWNQVQPVTTWHNKIFNSSVENCLRLAPSQQIEAFFVAELRKPLLPVSSE